VDDCQFGYIAKLKMHSPDLKQLFFFFLFSFCGEDGEFLQEITIYTDKNTIFFLKLFLHKKIASLQKDKSW
jgi:hypothetical protein